jgi:dTMP kinase
MIATPTKSGLYVAVEGGEGCGKSTAIAAIRGAIGDCVTTREPGSTPLAEKVRSVLQVIDDCPMNPLSEFSLFWAARFSTVRETVVPELERGVSVVSDRCAASTWAYQIRGRQLPELAEPFWSFWKILPRTPDLYIFLDLDPEEGLRRIFAGRQDEVSRIDLESLDFHRRVREGYKEFFSRMPPDRVIQIDASQPREAVSEAVASAIRGFGAPT